LITAIETQSAAAALPPPPHAPSSHHIQAPFDLGPAKGLPLVNVPDFDEDEITSLKTSRE